MFSWLSHPTQQLNLSFMTSNKKKRRRNSGDLASLTYPQFRPDFKIHLFGRYFPLDDLKRKLAEYTAVLLNYLRADRLCRQRCRVWSIRDAIFAPLLHSRHFQFKQKRNQMFARFNWRNVGFLCAGAGAGGRFNHNQRLFHQLDNEGVN